MKSFIFFCLSVVVVFAKHEVYDGYVVYEVYPNNIEAIQTLNDVVNELAVDIWSYATPEKPGQLFVSEEQKEPLEDALKLVGISFKVTIENIRELLEEEDQKMAAANAAASRNGNGTRLNINVIYTHDQINQYLIDIANRYPNRARLFNAGNSFGGRPIYYLEISTTNFTDTRKPVIFLQSLLHAREWVTSPSTLYAINKLVVDITENDLVNNIDWIIMPMANPDGYLWTFSNARFWRKNRRTGLVAGNVCVGVDLNRNFDINWATDSSNNVCSDTYHGRSAASESETQAVVRVMNKHLSRLAMYNDIHSAGSMILYGWGNRTLVPNHATLDEVGRRMARAIDAVKWPVHPNYVVGNIFNVLRYTASGGSTDFAQRLGLPYSYTFELPALLGSTGVNVFLVDPLFVGQSATETWEAIKVGARALR